MQATSNRRCRAVPDSPRYNRRMIQRPRYAPVHSAAKAENVPAGRSLPIEAVEGVGSTYGGRLREANVGTTNDLIVLGLVRGEQTIGEFWNQWLVEHTPLDPDNPRSPRRCVQVRGAQEMNRTSFHLPRDPGTSHRRRHCGRRGRSRLFSPPDDAPAFSRHQYPRSAWRQAPTRRWTARGFSKMARVSTSASCESAWRRSTLTEPAMCLARSVLCWDFAGTGQSPALARM